MTDTESNARYLRAWLQLKLEARTPLHVGSGSFAEMLDRVPGERKELRKRLQSNDRKPTYRAMPTRLDHKGRELVCIPGATIKGVLGNTLRGRLDEGYFKQIFASSEDSGRVGKASRQIGRVRFSDSRSIVSPSFVQALDSGSDSGAERFPPLWCAERGTGVRARVAIDPVTGAAKRHHLTFFEFVPEGSRIEFRFQCFDIGKAALEAFCQALAELDGIQVGAGAALGAGELGWADREPIHAEAVTQQQFAAWCLNPQAADSVPHHSVWPAHSDHRKHDAITADTRSIPLTLVAIDPVLITSGLDRDEKDSEGERKLGKYPDDLYVLQTPGGQVQIPASSLRGAIRARARKILIIWLRHFFPEQLNGDSARATNKAGEWADHLLESLFGSTAMASAVQVSDFTSTQSFARSQLHHQHFNAIDRFTGGVAKGALYEAWAAPVGTLFKGRIAFRQGKQPATWARLLLGLVLRDFARGDIPVGWGRAKGYGGLQLSLGQSSLSKLLSIDTDLSEDRLKQIIAEMLPIGSATAMAGHKDQEVSTHE